MRRNGPQQPPAEGAAGSEPPEEPQVPQEPTPPPETPPTPPPEQGEEYTEEELDELYDRETGEALLENNDGQPCDREGNVIPEFRPGFQAPQPPQRPAGNTDVGITPEGQQEQQRRPAFRSPFADGLLNEDERAAAEEMFTPEALRLIETLAFRVADRSNDARDQQRQAARQAGIPEELADVARRYERHVPAGIRGTPQGALTAAMMALGDEADQTGDFIGTLMKYAQGRQEPAPPPRREPPPLMPPSARSFSPGITPDPVRRTSRSTTGPRDSVNELFREDGLEGDVVAIIRRERGRS